MRQSPSLPLAFDRCYKAIAAAGKGLDITGSARLIGQNRADSLNAIIHNEIIIHRVNN